jgi:hypothetical protein
MDPAQDVHDEAHHVAYSCGKEMPKLLYLNINHILPFHRISVCIEKDSIQSSLIDKNRTSPIATALQSVS